MTIKNRDLNKANADIWVPSGVAPVLHDDPGYDDHVIRADWMESGYRALHCGYIPDREAFSSNDGTEGYFDVQSCLLKHAGSNDYKIPRQLSMIRSFIETAANDQHTRNPLAEIKYAVLYYRRWHVFFNQGQISTQWHTDDALDAIAHNGLSTKGLYPATDMAVQIYLGSDLAGTQVQTEPVRNIRSVFPSVTTGCITTDQQAAATRITDPYEITLINSYTRHRAMPLNEAFTRAAMQDHPSLRPLVDPTGGLRSFAALMYIPTESMRPLLGRHQKVRSGTSLVW